MYAEDPSNGFLPQAGTVLLYREPRGPGIRVDSAIGEGDVVSVHYDPLLAKLIVSAETRAAALARADRALGEFAILGIVTNIPLLRALVRHPDVRAGRLDTGLLGRLLPSLLPAFRRPAGGCGRCRRRARRTAWSARGGSAGASPRDTTPGRRFRDGGTDVAARAFDVRLGDTVVRVDALADGTLQAAGAPAHVEAIAAGQWRVVVDGIAHQRVCRWPGRRAVDLARRCGLSAGGGRLRAPGTHAQPRHLRQPVGADAGHRARHRDRARRPRRARRHARSCSRR